MRSNFADAYWTVAQLVAHHTVNGCNLRDGDLLRLGHAVGAAARIRADRCSSSATGRKAADPLSNGETRTFLEDGDTVILRGCCERDGFRRIGFGECRGTVLAAIGRG